MVSSAGSAITIVSIIVFVEVINQLIYKRDKENGI
jgi:hypothetical protein